jgi:hypothetical protein
MEAVHMAKVVSIWLGAIVTVALMVTALWAWHFAPELAMQNAERPYVAKLGIRSLSIALAAGAQVVLLAFVVARVYPPRLPDRVVGISIGIASFAALGTAVVLALSSR